MPFDPVTYDINGTTDDLAAHIAGKTKNVATVAAMTALPAAGFSAGAVIKTEEYHADTNYGGGLFRVVDDGSLTADNGYVFEFDSGGGTKRLVRLGNTPGVVNVLEFGARCDGNPANKTANTAAFQDAIDHLVANVTTNEHWGQTLLIPAGKDGSYVIDDHITVPSYLSGVAIQGVGLATIEQNTSNTAIFLLTNPVSTGQHRFHRFVLIEHIRFFWTTAQSSSNTNSIAIAPTNYPGFSGGGGWGQHIEVKHCYVEDGFRFFSMYPVAQTEGWNGSGFLSALHFENIDVRDCTGAVIHIDTPGGGCPNFMAKHIFIQCPGATEELFKLRSGVSAATFEGVEFNNITPGQRMMYLNIKSYLSLKNLHFEEVETDGADYSLIVLESARTGATVEGMTFRNFTVEENYDMVAVEVWQGRAEMTGACILEGTSSSIGNNAGLYLADTDNDGTVLFGDNCRFDAADSSDVTLTGTGHFHYTPTDNTAVVWSDTRIYSVAADCDWSSTKSAGNEWYMDKPGYILKAYSSVATAMVAGAINCYTQVDTGSGFATDSAYTHYITSADTDNADEKSKPGATGTELAEGDLIRGANSRTSSPNPASGEVGMFIAVGHFLPIRADT